MDTKKGRKEWDENNKAAEAQDPHFHPEILPPEKAFLVGEIHDEEPSEKRKVNAVIGAAEGLKDKEQADACKIPEGRIVEKPIKEQKTEGSPSKKEEFQMADMGHSGGAKSEDDS